MTAKPLTQVSNFADWVEHVLETDAEPYLRTPEEELSFVARHNLNVYFMVAAMVVFVGKTWLPILFKAISNILTAFI